MRRTSSPVLFTPPNWLCRSLSVSLGLTCLLRPLSAVAACDNFNPSSGQTATCDTSVPNPATSSVQAVSGSTGVTVIVEPGAGLSIVSGNGILVRDQSTVINMGTLNVNDDTFDGISSQDSGAGQNQITNRGTIRTMGEQSEGMFNSVAAAQLLNDTGGTIQTSGAGSAAMLDFASPGGGTLMNNGTLSTSGDSSEGMGAFTNNDVLVNNGSITTTGAASHGLFANGGAVSGPGNNVLTNHGTIDVYGTNAHGIVSLDASPGVVTNTGSITAHGPDGLGAFFSGPVTLNNAAGASLVSEQANAIVANAGGTFNNAGVIAGANEGVSIVGGGAGILNSGTIRGGSNLAISTTGNFPITITNTGTITGGNGVAVWTDTGTNTFNMNGGTVSGLIRQGTGTNTFNMLAGEVDDVDQGGSQARFTMSGGRIDGSLTNGGEATITGGRIGAVGLTAAGNRFVMSGGQVDADVSAGSGDTVFALSGGTIGGGVGLGNGANALNVTGGSVAQGIASGDGPNTFAWRDGGTIAGPVSFGAGPAAVTLSGLSDVNLAGLTKLDGGAGTDALTFDNTRAGALGRFVNWETIDAINGSRLTLDANGLTLGDSGTRTGALEIDATSTLFAGTSAIQAAVAGQLATLRNAGTIDLTTSSPSAHATLVVNGNYVGQGGSLLLRSVLGGDGAPSDKLVIAQGVASGSTTIGVTNVGGTGLLTVKDGILVVQATDGASTSATAFTLTKPISAGAYAYHLFRGGVSAGTADDWYLRSSLIPVPPSTPSTPSTPSAPSTPSPPVTPPVTPPINPTPPPPAQSPPAETPVTPLYRMEVPVYGEIPVLARELGIEQIGTFHDRQGAQSLLSRNGAVPATWTRAWGSHANLESRSGADPQFSGTTGGVQIGQDVYTDASAAGHGNHYGFLLGFARAEGDVSGFALGVPDLPAGHLAINAYSLGLYWTHVGGGGWYTDSVAMGSTLSIDPSSNDGIGASSHGHAFAGSFEAGLPIPLGAGLSLEPQAQLILQHVALGDLNDGVSSVSFDNPSTLAGRLGVRLESRVEALGALWQPYARVNLWRYFGGSSDVTFGGTTAIPSTTAATAAQFELGVVTQVTKRGSVFATVNYVTNVNGARRTLVGGNAGVRWSW
jgi:outer membrane autotransporter protein